MACNSIKQVNILSHNVHSIKRRLPAINHLNEMYKINIALLQETWLNEEDKIMLQHLKIHRNDRATDGGGVAIGLTP